MADLEMDEFEGNGMTRRTLIKRSAIVGGTVLWAAPVVQSFTSPAFGQVGTPAGKDLSYIAFYYDCGEGAKGIKIEFNDDLTYSCAGQASPIHTPFCGNDTTGNDLVYAGAGAGDCAKFDIAVLAGGATVVVTFKDAFLETCDFLAEAAVGKCGNPDNPNSGGACVNAIVGLNSLTFTMCLAD